MGKLSKKVKRKVFLHALEVMRHARDNDTRTGLCWAVECGLISVGYKVVDRGFGYLEEVLPELLSVKPTGSGRDWWAEGDYESRLDALVVLINIY